MGKWRHILHAAVSAETKRRVKVAAAADLVTPSAWLRRVAIRALGRPPATLERSELEEPSRDLRDHRLSVRFSPEDCLLLEARALARGMRPATYASVLIRSHLRSLAPLPKDELLALKQAVSELGALTRDLQRIVHVLGQDGRAATSGKPDLQAVVRLCRVLRSDTKALIQANVNSWEIGRPLSASTLRHPTRL
jgi:hypothetical protein